MPVEILGALVIDDFGAPARLQVCQNPDPTGSSILPSPEKLPHPTSRCALKLAHHYVSSLIGWPAKTRVEWSLVHAANVHFTLPPLRGPSLFGAFSMAFLRSVVVDSRAAVKPWAMELSGQIADTPMERIAVSAAFDPFSGRFKSVGSMGLKLAELARLGPATCKLCVVSESQPIQLELLTRTPYYEIYRLDDRLSLPIVRAIDPLDAFRRIFAIQAISALC